MNILVIQEIYPPEHSGAGIDIKKEHMSTYVQSKTN